MIAEQEKAEQERLRLEAQQKAEAEKQRLLLEKQKREEQERQALVEAQRKAEEWKAERQRELLAKQEEENRIKAEQEQQRQKEAEAEKQRAYLAQYEEQKRLQQEKAQQEAEAAKQKQLEAEKLRQQEEAEKQKQLFKHQISPKPLMGNLAGPPPVVDDFEVSPKKGGPVPLMSLTVEAPTTSGEKVAPPVAANRDVKLPQGLEEVLAFKSKWATQQGHQPSEIARVEREGVVFQTDQIPQAEVVFYFSFLQGRCNLVAGYGSYHTNILEIYYTPKFQ